ncbi:hypothetical protein MYMA111404_00005 [Mycoplasma marinum]|uniref:Uncharacterized protein n=1 Tax=Mycoplasma marinum TaxID=1937190 RepID=A0A4R0XS33_9MOLU|nr:hypothetical protein [Mycoplasma marinum]TCG11688.1 hypothetical protein C4B24_00850 [Mycoplasma marinum]
MKKIKKHIKEHMGYDVYETEDGQKGIIDKKEKLYPGDKVDLKNIPSSHPIFKDLESKAETAVLEISWILSKI